MANTHEVGGHLTISHAVEGDLATNDCPPGEPIDAVTTAVEPTTKPARAMMLFINYPPDALIAEEVLANEFRKSLRTIRRWEKDGTIPPRDPKTKLWRVGNIKDWIMPRMNRQENSARAYNDHLVEIAAHY